MKRRFHKLSRAIITFSGEDYYTIKKSNSIVKQDFTIIGALVLIILTGCFISAFTLTDRLFHNRFLDIGVGLVWSYIVTNLYVLLLYTITPTLLPVKIRRGGRIRKTRIVSYEVSLAMILRVSMMLLLAIIIAQPLNILILKNDSTQIAADIKFLLATNPIALFNTLIVISILLLPIYLKYRIRKFKGFYELKANINRRIVKDEYDEFKKQYSALFEKSIQKYNEEAWRNLDPLLSQLKFLNREKHEMIIAYLKKEFKQENITKFEYWQDAPFRTENRKLESLALSENELLNLIYPGKE